MFLAMMIIISVVSLVLSILMIVSLWKLFEKANKEGWKSIIPVLNILVLLEISGLKPWNIVFFFIPIVNFVYIFKTFIGLAKKFQKNAGFGVMTTFFPFIGIPILAFSKCEYGLNEEKEAEVSILDVDNAGVPNESEKPEFSYGYEKEPTIVMDPVSQEQIKGDIEPESSVNNISDSVVDINNMPESTSNNSDMLSAAIPELNKNDASKEENIVNESIPSDVVSKTEELKVNNIDSVPEKIEENNNSIKEEESDFESIN